MRRSQISLFIIISLTIIVFLGFFIASTVNTGKDRLEIQTDKTTDLSKQKSSAYNYIDECLSDASVRSIAKIGLSDEESLEAEVKNEFCGCIDDDYMDSIGISLDMDEVSVDVFLEDGSKAMITLMTLPTEIPMPDSTTKIDSFRSKIDITKEFALEMDEAAETITAKETKLITDDKGLEVNIPEGTRVTDKDGSPLDSISVTLLKSDDVGIAGPNIYSLTDAEFDSPVKLTFNYREEDLRGYDEEDLTIVYLSNGIWRAIPTTVDVSNNQVIGWTDHFSTFAIHGDCGMKDGEEEVTFVFAKDVSDFIEAGTIYSHYVFNLYGNDDRKVCINSFELENIFSYPLNYIGLKNANTDSYSLFDEGIASAFGECISDPIVEISYKELKKQFNNKINNDDTLSTGKNNIFFDSDMQMTEEYEKYIVLDNKAENIRTYCEQVSASVGNTIEECITNNKMVFSEMNGVIFSFSGNFILVDDNSCNEENNNEFPCIEFDKSYSSTYEIGKKFITKNNEVSPEYLENYFFNVDPGYHTDDENYVTIPPAKIEEDGTIIWRTVSCPEEEIDLSDAGLACVPGTADAEVGEECRLVEKTEEYTWQNIIFSCEDGLWIEKESMDTGISCDPNEAIGNECDPLINRHRQACSGTEPLCSEGEDEMWEKCRNGYWVQYTSTTACGTSPCGGSSIIEILKGTDSPHNCFSGSIDKDQEKTGDTDSTNHIDACHTPQECSENMISEYAKAVGANGRNIVSEGDEYCNQLYGATTGETICCPISGDSGIILNGKESEAGTDDAICGDGLVSGDEVCDIKKYDEGGIGCTDCLFSCTGGMQYECLDCKTWSKPMCDASCNENTDSECSPIVGNCFPGEQCGCEEGDVCSTDCRCVLEDEYLAGLCGNGIIDEGEVCDNYYNKENEKIPIWGEKRLYDCFDDMHLSMCNEDCSGYFEPYGHNLCIYVKDHCELASEHCTGRKEGDSCNEDGKEGICDENCQCIDNSVCGEEKGVCAGKRVGDVCDEVAGIISVCSSDCECILKDSYLAGLCGNGMLDEGEVCDIALSSGWGEGRLLKCDDNLHISKCNNFCSTYDDLNVCGWNEEHCNGGSPECHAKAEGETCKTEDGKEGTCDSNCQCI